MRMPGCTALAVASGALALLGLVGPSSRAEAGDIIVFASQNDPRDNWNYGYGAALTSTWFKVIGLEAEAARFPGRSTDASMTAFSGSALLAPPIGKLTLYAGAGIGLFRQSRESRSDTGILRARIFGLKLKIKDLLVLKAEYRGIRLSGDPLIELDRRLSVGTGIVF